MKPCKRCARLLPVDEFYRHAAMADGRLSFCKECVKARVRKHRADNLARVQAYDRARFHEPERHAYALQQTAHYRVVNPDKIRARHAVSNAIRSKRMIRQPCSICGASSAEAHHADYRKQLDVTWLCKEHHVAQHK